MNTLTKEMKRDTHVAVAFHKYFTLYYCDAKQLSILHHLPNFYRCLICLNSLIPLSQLVNLSSLNIYTEGFDT